LLPVASELFCIESQGREILLLFFRPGPDCVAVYDPRFGTAIARTKATSSAKVVELVAERLGYRVASIRTDTCHLIAAGSP
jgi:hypothetical protein